MTNQRPSAFAPPPPPPAPAPIQQPPPIPPQQTRKKKHWFRRFLILLLVVAVGWLGVSALLLRTGMARVEAMTSLDASGGGPPNYLLVGSDSRANLNDSLGDNFAAAGGERADVIMLVHASPTDRRVQMLSIPRDLKVDIPGHGTNKVNAALAFGGPDLLVQTVRQATGIPIHHYVEVGFEQFADVVDTLGGVTIDFPYAARDAQSGLSVGAGAQLLDGAQAVAFARSRQYEEQRSEGWVKVGASDIGRTERQQLLLAKLLSTARNPANFTKLPMLSSALGGSLTADAGLSLFDLAALGAGVGVSAGFDTMTLPVTVSNEGGVSYVVATDAAPAVIAAFKSGDPFPAAG